MLDAKGVPIDHVAYNALAGIAKRYTEGTPSGNADEHLLERVPEVLRRAVDPRAKLQYFQAMYDFPT